MIVFFGYTNLITIIVLLAVIKVGFAVFVGLEAILAGLG